MRRAAAALAAALLLLALAPALAGAKKPGSAPPDPNALVIPPRQDRPPAGHVRSARQVLAIAARAPRIRTTLAHHRGATSAAYEKGTKRWQVSYFAKRRDPKVQGKEIAQVTIDDRTGKVIESWTGFQVPWSMARGYPGAFGRKVGAIYIWIPLCLLFVIPFVDPRRPFRLLHLDLLMLVGLSVSLAFFSHGKIGVSVPLAYPPLAYLLVRMLFAARSRRGPPAAIRLLVPTTWLVVGLIFLLGFRIGLNVTNSNVIDVGYAGVIGADRLTHGKTLYGTYPADNQHGNTYGPAVYYAYVPFEQAFPWDGRWDDLPAAHGAAIFFDLLTILLLFLLGRRIRGPTLGIALAYAWAAYPFTLFALNSNSNDSFVAALVLAAILAAAGPVRRGALAAIAGLTKFAPLGLVPLLATYRDPSRPARSLARTLVLFATGFAATAAALVAWPLLHGGVRDFYEHSVRFQAQRESPFSVWGLVGGLDTEQHIVQGLAVLLALVVAFVPRRRDLVTLSALAAAVSIALQLGVTHWFYLYIPWFFGLVMVALLGRGIEPRGAAAAKSDLERGREPARSRPPALASSR
ncbi:MAG TPA: glycosyltransferase 87 family protein [Solirubrobacteraceae bacterium]